MEIQVREFGERPGGEKVQQYDCINDTGCRLRLIDYGAHVTSVEVPDRSGTIRNVTLGFEDLNGYLLRHPYFGSTVGRFCNRIANGRFEIDGTIYTLAKNNGPNSLHGGVEGFDRFVWRAEPFSNDNEVGVVFHRVSPDGEEGYPGNLDVQAKYAWNNQNELTIEFTATTDKPTPVNLTNHAYWNLRGVPDQLILDHELQVEADDYLPVDGNLIPTGERKPVADTPLDFRTFQPIGARIDRLDSDPAGYDHCYALRRSGELSLAATLRDSVTGRQMEVFTTQPGIQVYTSNFLDGSANCGGFPQYAAVCLETQNFPDSPNQPTFPTSILRPGERYHHRTVYRFSTF